MVLSIFNKNSHNRAYLDANNGLDSRVSDLLSRLTLDDKCRLLSGYRHFRTKKIKTGHVRIQSMKLTDGPLGVSKHSSSNRRNTRFPGGICLAATWNRDLAYQYGRAVGEEARATGRHCILAPGINIDRSPLNGRTFEYLSEDPYLIKEIAIPYVNGVQSLRVAVSVKHFCANNQETNRFTVNAVIPERALHEIYLRAFKEVVIEADPWTIMGSYNRVNGKYVYESPDLINGVLVEKWGFSGFVMTDWMATSRGQRVPKGPPNIRVEDMIRSLISLEMPFAYVYKPRALKQALEEKRYTIDELDEVVRRILRVFFLVGLFDDKLLLPKGSRNTPEHRKLAQTMAEEGMVLLKNCRSILPLDMSKIKSLAVLGPNATKKFGKLLYGGSSAVKPPHEITPLIGLKKRCKGVVKIHHDPSAADYVIIFVGLNHDSEGKLTGSRKEGIVLYGNDCEGTDREYLELPPAQIQLINETLKINPNTIVVLLNGSPVAMSEWIDDVPAVLEAWYPGQEGGHAVANALFGDINPSGKLPITFPECIEDSPAHKSTRAYPGENLEVYYDEGVYVGYRFFDKQDIEPLFPYGFGLSYTTFLLNDVTLSKSTLESFDDTLSVFVHIKNIGTRDGKEVIQIYANDEESGVDRPLKELVGFEKIALGPSEEKTVEIMVNARDLAFYDETRHAWYIEPGTFRLFIGTSSRDLPLECTIEYKG